MDTLSISTSSLITFFSFLVVGSVIVYLILRFDKLQRRKMNILLTGAKDVQPLFMQKAAIQKLTTLKSAANEGADDKEMRQKIAKQLDELVTDYDKGRVTLPDYCKRLNRLLAQVA